MTGINKRSNQPRVGQKKINVNVNPLYNTSALIKAAGDRIRDAVGKKKIK